MENLSKYLLLLIVVLILLFLFYVKSSRPINTHTTIVKTTSADLKRVPSQDGTFAITPSKQASKQQESEESEPEDDGDQPSSNNRSQSKQYIPASSAAQKTKKSKPQTQQPVQQQPVQLQPVQPQIIYKLPAPAAPIVYQQQLDPSLSAGSGAAAAPVVQKSQGQLPNETTQDYMNRIQKEFQAAEARRKKMEEEIKRLAAAIPVYDDYEDMPKHLRDRLSQMGYRQDELEKQIKATKKYDTLEDLPEDVRERFKQMKETTNDLSEDQKQLSERIDGDIKKLTDRIQAIEGALAEKKNDKSAAELEELQATHSKCLKEYATLLETKNALDQNIQTLQGTINRLQEDTANYTQCQSDLKTTRESYQAAQRKIEALESRVQDLESTTIPKTTCQSDIKAKDAEMTALQTSTVSNSLYQELLNNYNNLKEKSVDETKYNSLQDSYRSLKDSTTLTTIYNELDQQYSKTKQDLANLKKDTVSVTDYNKLSEDLQSLRTTTVSATDYNKLSDDLSALKLNTVDKTAHEAELKAVRGDLQQAKQDLQNANDDLETKKKALETALQAVRDKTNVEEELKQVRQELTNIKTEHDNKVQNLQDDIDAHLADITLKGGQIATLTQHNSSITAATDNWLILQLKTKFLINIYRKLAEQNQELELASDKCSKDLVAEQNKHNEFVLQNQRETIELNSQIEDKKKRIKELEKEESTAKTALDAIEEDVCTFDRLVNPPTDTVTEGEFRTAQDRIKALEETGKGDAIKLDELKKKLETAEKEHKKATEATQAAQDQAKDLERQLNALKESINAAFQSYTTHIAPYITKDETAIKNIVTHTQKLESVLTLLEDYQKQFEAAGKELKKLRNESNDFSSKCLEASKEVYAIVNLPEAEKVALENAPSPTTPTAPTDDFDEGLTYETSLDNLGNLSIIEMEPTAGLTPLQRRWKLVQRKTGYVRNVLYTSKYHRYDFNTCWPKSHVEIHKIQNYLLQSRNAQESGIKVLEMLNHIIAGKQQFRRKLPAHSTASTDPNAKLLEYTENPTIYTRDQLFKDPEFMYLLALVCLITDFPIKTSLHRTYGDVCDAVKYTHENYQHKNVALVVISKFLFACRFVINKKRERLNLIGLQYISDQTIDTISAAENFTTALIFLDALVIFAKKDYTCLNIIEKHLPYVYNKKLQYSSLLHPFIVTNSLYPALSDRYLANLHPKIYPHLTSKNSNQSYIAYDDFDVYITNKHHHTQGYHKKAQLSETPENRVPGLYMTTSNHQLELKAVTAMQIMHDGMPICIIGRRIYMHSTAQGVKSMEFSVNCVIAPEGLCVTSTCTNFLPNKDVNLLCTPIDSGATVNVLTSTKLQQKTGTMSDQSMKLYWTNHTGTQVFLIFQSFPTARAYFERDKAPVSQEIHEFSYKNTHIYVCYDYIVCFDIGERTVYIKTSKDSNIFNVNSNVGLSECSPGARFTLEQSHVAANLKAVHTLNMVKADEVWYTKY